MKLKRQYIVDENNRKVAVQFDDEDENLNLEDAKNYYADLTKTK